MEEKFMREAVAAAAEGVARGDGGPFGAVIVRNGLVVSRAWNRVIRDQDPTAHAEVNAIREACRLAMRFHLEDCELYTSCEPCPMCLGAIYWARLSAVYYAATREDAEGIGFSDAQIYNEIASLPSERTLRFVRMETASAVSVMRAWQTETGRCIY